MVCSILKPNMIKQHYVENQHLVKWEHSVQFETQGNGRNEIVNQMDRSEIKF